MSCDNTGCKKVHAHWVNGLNGDKYCKKCAQAFNKTLKREIFEFKPKQTSPVNNRHLLRNSFLTIKILEP